MAQITLQGSPVTTIGELPEIGTKGKDFKLVNQGLEVKSLSDYAGSKIVLNIFPSIDTPTCATSVRSFNKQVSALENTKVLCISKDLPFAMGRFCGAEGIENVEVLSDFRNGDFGKDYGLTITDSVLEGLHSRAVVVLDESGKVLHSEQVSEIADEPNYEAAFKVL